MLFSFVGLRQHLYLSWPCYTSVCILALGAAAVNIWPIFTYVALNTDNMKTQYVICKIGTGVILSFCLNCWCAGLMTTQKWRADLESAKRPNLGKMYEHRGPVVTVRLSLTLTERDCMGYFLSNMKNDHWLNSAAKKKEKHYETPTENWNFRKKYFFAL